MGREMRDLIKGTVKDHRLVSPNQKITIIAGRLQLPLQPANAQSHLPQGTQAIPRYQTHHQAKHHNAHLRHLRKRLQLL